ALPNLWIDDRYDADFKRAREYAMNMFHPVDVDEAALVAQPAVGAHVDLRENNDGAIRIAADFHAARDAIITGIGVWFRAQLTRDVALTNQPPNRCPSWKQSFFPIASRMRVDRGDAIGIEMQTFD